MPLISYLGDNAYQVVRTLGGVLAPAPSWARASLIFFLLVHTTAALTFHLVQPLLRDFPSHARILFSFCVPFVLLVLLVIGIPVALGLATLGSLALLLIFTAHGHVVGAHI